MRPLFRLKYTFSVGEAAKSVATKLEGRVKALVAFLRLPHSLQITFFLFFLSFEVVSPEERPQNLTFFKNVKSSFLIIFQKFLHKWISHTHFTILIPNTSCVKFVFTWLGSQGVGVWNFFYGSCFQFSKMILGNRF